MDVMTSDDLALARAIATAARAVPGVADLSRGDFGETVTYGPKQSVAGVRVGRRGSRSVVHIHLVAEYRPEENLRDLANRVRRQALGVAGAGECRIDITVQDLFLTSQGT